MSRYRGPKLRIIRRLGDLPGLTTKISKKKIDLVNQVKLEKRIVKKNLLNMVEDWKKNKS